MWNRHKLTLEVTADRETALKWAQENFLLYSLLQCHQHKCEMRYYINRGRFGTFRCPKNKNHTSSRPGEISAATGTWFAGHHIDANKAFSLMMSFCDNDSYEKLAERRCLMKVVVPQRQYVIGIVTARK